MTEPVKSELELRLVQLERRLGFLRAALTAVVMAVVVGVMFFSLHSHFSSTQSNGILRVKGLIVEDGEGRERILIGAPVPVVSGRKRRDGAVGLLVLGENGADRIAIGAPYPDPQSQGKVRERYANHRLVTRGRPAIEACHSSEVTSLPLVGQPIG